MKIEIQLRQVVESDYSIFFDHHRDPVSARMAAFVTKDPDAGELAARWKRSLADESTMARTIVEGGQVVGFVATFLREGKPQVTYWIARSHWGRGIATAALSQLLQRVTARPNLRKRSDTQPSVASCAGEMWLHGWRLAQSLRRCARRRD